MVTPEELTALSEVCIKYGIQHLKTQELEMTINPSSHQMQKLTINNMNKKELEELLYAST